MPRCITNFGSGALAARKQNWAQRLAGHFVANCNPPARLAAIFPHAGHDAATKHACHDGAAEGAANGAHRDTDRVRRMKIALLFLLIGAIAWWSHVGAASVEPAKQPVRPI